MFFYADFFHDFIYEIPVVVFDSQRLGQHLADFRSAAAEFTSHSDDEMFHFVSPFF